ncbi:MAG: helix-turn-helix transcriptional regulator [Actinomycetota bacterium]
MHPVERLVNLTALLLESRRPLTFGEIRERIPSYGQGELTASKRMFERDKDVLREAGIPVELVATDAYAVEDGYTIPKERYYLPEIDFTKEEMSALYVASHSPAAGGEAEQAALKLRAASSAPLAETTAPVATAGPDLAGPRLLEAAEATLGRRSIRFGYRSTAGEPATRHVDPWALLWRGGHWYVVGLDRDRGEPRSFRLSRFLTGVEDAGEGSPPPEGFDARAQLTAGPWGIGEPAGRARVAFAPEVAWWAASSVPGGEVVATRQDGWVELDIPGGAAESLASWVLSFGADAEALEPPELRDEVIARLEATLASL